MDEQTRKQETQQLSARLKADKEKVGDNSSEEIEGKAKAVATEIKNVADKVAILGSNVFSKFKDLLNDPKVNIKLTDIKSLDAETIQKQLDGKIDGLKETNNQTLLKLDNGLDQILHRVQMRKDLAKSLADFPPQLTQRDAIGTLFEQKMNALESVDFSLQQDVAKNREKDELVREFTKYTEIIKATTSGGAFRTTENNEDIIKKAITVPKVGIAYQVGNNVQYFRYWTQMDGDRLVVYGIDNTHGRIQKYDPAGPATGKDAWQFVDTSGKEFQEFTTEKYRTKRGNPKDNLKKLMGLNPPKNEDIETMKTNQYLERGYIDASTRNHTATPEERRIWTNYETRFNQLRDENVRRYQTNPEHAPYGHNLREMYAYTHSDAYRASLRGIMNDQPQVESPESVSIRNDIAPSSKDISFKEDAKLERNDGPLSASGSALKLLELNPLNQEKTNNGIERSIKRITQNGQPLNNAIELSGNEIQLKAGEKLPVGPVEITFEIKNTNDTSGARPLEKKVILNILPGTTTDRVPENMLYIRDRLAKDIQGVTNLNIVPGSRDVWEVANNDQTTQIQKSGNEYKISIGATELKFPETNLDLAIYSAAEINRVVNGFKNSSFEPNKSFFAKDTTTLVNERLIEANVTGFTTNDAVVLKPGIDVDQFLLALNTKMTLVKNTSSIPMPREDSAKLYKGEPLLYTIPGYDAAATYRYSIDNGKTWVQFNGDRIYIPKEQIPTPTGTEKVKLILSASKNGMQTSVKNIELTPTNPYEMTDVVGIEKDAVVFSRGTQSIIYNRKSNDLPADIQYQFDKSGENQIKIMKKESTDGAFVQIATATANLETGVLENLQFQNDATGASYSTKFDINIDPTTDRFDRSRDVWFKKKQ